MLYILLMKINNTTITFSTTIDVNSTLFSCPSFTDDNVFLLKRERKYVLKKFEVRRRCTVPSPLTWPFTMTSDDT